MTYQDKVRLVRNNIVSNAQVYKNILAGKYYLYIFENQCFEMYFGTDNYLHLTGVGSRVGPNQFYELAKNNQLQDNQLFFSNRFPLKTALQKTSSLSCLPNFISEGYFVIKDLVTETETYPYVITNIEQSVLIGLKKEENEEIYIPKSFRVKGNIFDKADANKLFEINWILSKIDKKGLYDKVLYKDKVCLGELDNSILCKIEIKMQEEVINCAHTRMEYKSSYKLFGEKHNSNVCNK